MADAAHAVIMSLREIQDRELAARRKSLLYFVAFIAAALIVIASLLSLLR